MAGGQGDLELVEVGVRCSLEQMLEEGFYHSDPHPGNLLHTEDGRLAYIDFGMMGYIEPSIRRHALLTFKGAGYTPYTVYHILRLP